MKLICIVTSPGQIEQPKKPITKCHYCQTPAHRAIHNILFNFYTHIQRSQYVHMFIALWNEIWQTEPRAETIVKRQLSKSW